MAESTAGWREADKSRHTLARIWTKECVWNPAHRELVGMIDGHLAETHITSWALFNHVLAKDGGGSTVG
jgi:hypothetical protein